MKTVLITGVGKGIGLALAEKFLAKKYFVVGTYLSGEQPFAQKNFAGYQLDLASPKSIARCSEAILRSHKKIDIQINNAGALFDEDETSVVVEKLRKTLEVNLIGPIDFTERMLVSIHKGGHIINISSTAGSLALAGKAISHFPYHYPSYKISKTAVNMFTVTLAQQLKKKGIIVSSVHPGWVKTDMGGAEAKISPEQAANQIVDFAMTHPKTGGFWYAGKKLPW